ncbi:MAG: hypothetical protein NXH99_24295 [Rhodobacteraceae bacterium]|nr:hypothetical protein [Paracoccaceae bacterium]
MWATIVEQGRALLAACRLMPLTTYKTKNLEIRATSATEVTKIMQEHHRFAEKPKQ